MRTEQLAAKALKRLDGDRYLLANVIFERIRELSSGAKPLVDMDVKRHKFSDIALREVAEGYIELDKLVPQKS